MKKDNKIASERINRLFDLAEEIHKSKREDKNELAKRYLSLAKRIGEKNTTPIPKEMKKKFCKNCFSMNVEGKEEKPFFIVQCKDCNFVKKYSLENK